MDERSDSPSGAGLERLAWSRIAVAAGCLALPGVTGRIWAGKPGTGSDVGAIVRSFAIRDLALGLGLLRAVRASHPTRGWVEMGVLSDAVDLCFAAVGPATPRRRHVVGIGVAGYVVAGTAALLRGGDRAVAT